MATNEEQEAWDTLYDQRVGRLREYFHNASDERKGYVLGVLESITLDIIPGMRKTVRDYTDGLDDPETVQRIIRILDNPDESQIRDISKNNIMAKVARSLGVPADALRQTKNRLLKGDAKSSYVAAKFAHWLIEQGYRVEE